MRDLDHHFGGETALGEGLRLVLNPRAAPKSAPLKGPLSAVGFDAAFAEISGWDDYAPTPLLRLDTLSEALGVRAVWYKDEAHRFGLGSFKPLGAAYACARVMAQRMEADGVAERVSAQDVVRGRYREAAKGIIVVSATDGNHGRALAWAARRFGATAEILVHPGVSPGRRAAMEALGARVRVTAGSYDDSVREAFRTGEAQGWPVVQDTSIGAYRDVPMDICHGYGVMGEETVRALDAPPTHALVQAGVGGLASALCAQFWRHYGAMRPRFITLEPTSAACVAASIEAGTRVATSSETHSVMAGLDCGEVSETAWEVLSTGADAALVIDDGLAYRGMRHLARPPSDDAPIIAGECAGGAVGALLVLSERADLAARIGLDPEATVLIIGTEGATDQAIYNAVVSGGGEQRR